MSISPDNGRVKSQVSNTQDNLNHDVLNGLTSATTEQLLRELFGRFKESMFVGHSSDRVHPIQFACDLPQKSTGMHSALTTALDRVLAGLKRKYPDTETPTVGLYDIVPTSHIPTNGCTGHTDGQQQTTIPLVARNRQRGLGETRELNLVG